MQPRKYSGSIIWMLLILGCVLINCSNIYAQNGNQWEAPVDVETLVNPVVGNQEEILKGKKIYNQLCTVCHGNKGKGDGIAGINLNPRPANLTKLNNQSDGAIYWKITEGRPPMVPYKDILTVQQRWQVVSYIKTLND